MLTGVRMPRAGSTEYKADFYSLQNNYVITDHFLFSDNFGLKFDVYRDGKKLDKL